MELAKTCYHNMFSADTCRSGTRSRGAARDQYLSAPVRLFTVALLGPVQLNFQKANTGRSAAGLISVETTTRNPFAFFVAAFVLGADQDPARSRFGSEVRVYIRPE